MKVISEHLRSSEQQTLIKHSESFERVWRTVCTQAARTLKQWADPEGKTQKKRDSDEGGEKETYIDDDILSGDKIKLAVGGDFAGLKHYNNYAKLLFGDPLQSGNDQENNKKILYGDKSFTAESEEKARGILNGALKTVSVLRNEIFHFKDRKTFLCELSKIANKEAIKEHFLPLAQKRFAADQQGQKDRVITTIKGLQLEHYAPGNMALRTLALAAINNSDNDLTIPTYKRVIKRYSNIREFYQESDHKLLSLAPWQDDNVNDGAAHDDAAQKAQYGALQIVYNTEFRQWLEKPDNVPQLVELNNTVIQETTKRARQSRDPNDPFKNLAEGKASDLPKLAEIQPAQGDKCTPLEQWMDKLNQFVTTEMKLNQQYEPDPNEVRKASEWVEKFRCEFFVLAFNAFLNSDQGKPYCWLCQETGLKRCSTPCELPEVKVELPNNTMTEAWAAILYAFLHFVPKQDASRLLHQFSKSAALEATTSDQDDGFTDRIKTLKRVCLLYVAMSHAHFTGGQSITAQLHPFRDLYEKPEDFDRLMQPQKTNDYAAQQQAEKIEGVQKGLRQILRFGTFDLLRGVMPHDKISNQYVEEFLQNTTADDHGTSNNASQDTSLIAQWQKKRRTLHNALKELNNTTPHTSEIKEEIKNKVKDYTEVLEKIKAHDQLARTVRLHDLAAAHSILTSIMSKLIDFSAIWERDALFVFLALYQGQDNYCHKKARDIMDELAHERLDKITQLLSDDNLRFYQRYFGKQKAKIRNDFAHFNILKSGLNITEQLNRVRDLLSYDRKLKNSLSKSIKDILRKEGLSITWSMQEHRLACAYDDNSLRSDKLEHLSFMRKAIPQLKGKDKKRSSNTNTNCKNIVLPNRW